MTRPGVFLLGLAASAALMAVLPLPSTAQAAGQPAATEIRRFALIVGSNEGGAGRVRLRYATSDATSFAHVLHDLGGIRGSEQVLLIEPDRATMQQAFDRMRQLVAAARGAGTRLELVFYYSGHSDEDGLLPRGERVAYGEVKRWIEQAGADVRIAILDSCASGALTRAKGGVRRAPFLVDGSSHASGHAFLTASSADEAAQESDRLGAAFFTHYLLSGLRGAADSSRDGRVTLNEAYQYAFHETLARTEQTRAGAQHPTYDFQLTGSGDLVMTDLHGASATLTIADEVTGRVFVRDSQGHLVAEVRKVAGHPVELGLEPGRYSMTLEDDRGLRAASVSIGRGSRARLAFADLAPLSPIATVSRGDGAGPDEPAATLVTTVPPGPGPEYRHVPLAFGMVPSFRTGIVPPLRSIDHFIIGFPWAGTDKLQGVAAALGASWVSEDVRGGQLSVGMNYAGATSHALQATVGANVVAGSLAGGQSSVGFNTVAGDMRGFQTTVGFNIVGGKLHGAQMAVGFNLAGEVDRQMLQLAVGMNLASGNATGLQAAVGINEFGGKLRGAQFGVGLNRASAVEGAQIALLNVGSEIHGAQIGLINIARNVRGMQLGLVNVAQTSSASIGLLSFIRDGQLHLDFWSNEVGNLSLGLKVGGRHFYTLLFGSIMPKGTDRAFDSATQTAGDHTRYASGLGLGLHLDNGPHAYTNIELMSAGVHDAEFSYTNSNSGNPFALVNTVRLLVGFQLAPNLAIFGGPAFNVAIGFEGRDFAYGTGVLENVYHSGQTTVRTYPSLVLGVQI